MIEIAHRHIDAATKPSGRDPVSALGRSAASRLLLIAPVLVAIWAGVYWALT